LPRSSPRMPNEDGRSLRESPHLAALGDLGLAPRWSSPLAAYLDRLAVWNDRVNLTGARTPEERVRILVADPVAAHEAISAGPLIDVGSGNGSPGLVLALLRPDLQVTLLEPRLRRWAFLRDVVRGLGREDIEVLRARHDRYSGEGARTVTLRALALPLAELAPLVAPGGDLLVFGGNPEQAPPFRLTGETPLRTTTLHRFTRECAT
jgi:16S rRNA (guanine527-N7)-methyltransferase